jgi:hypothetical protein
VLILFVPVANANSLQARSPLKSFFNPSTGEHFGLTLNVPERGKLTVLVLDRDGYSVRVLSADKTVTQGSTLLTWDGRDDAGVVVPDEAYSFKVDLVGGTHPQSYFPASMPTLPVSVPVRYYDRFSGILSYVLPTASRVHIQAGTAIIDAKGQPDGPVLKTVADRQPRSAGAVIEQWDGMDESKTIRVADLPHFAISILATPLPENSVITVGNRRATFVAYASERRGASLLPAGLHSSAHHAGLQAIDDTTPPLQVTMKNGVWSDREKAWRTDAPDGVIDVVLQGPTGSRFAMHSTGILVFVDGHRVATEQSTQPSTELRVELPNSGLHTIAVNWVNGNGPVAVNALRCDVSAR